MSDDTQVFARLLVACLTIMALVAVAIVGGIVALTVILLEVRGQGERNQRHTDCIVASVAPNPPEYCVQVIEHLRSEGILRPTTVSTALPTTTTS